LVTDNARVGLVMINVERRYTFANDTYVRMLAIDLPTIIGRRVGEVLPALYESQIRPRLDQAFAGERGAYELSVTTPGGPHHFAVRYEPMALPSGDPTVLVVLTDVTERKMAEEQMRASEARYRTLFEYAPDGILIDDGTGRYLDANASACRMFGYTREEFIGLRAAEIIAPTEIAHVPAAIDHIKRGDVYHREWQFRRKDGSVFAAEVMATAMPDGNLMGMVRDITERRQAEEAIQAQLSELRRWHVMTLGREEHIISLKREINELLAQQNLPRRYNSPDAPL
jgi:PAS domain S-box-containing protein